MSLPAERLRISAEDYLEGEEHSDIKHEYINGAVYAMTGVSRSHNLINGNLFAALHAHLRGGSCRVFMADMKTHIKTGEDELFYYPDIQVTCTSRDNARCYNEHPKLIIEVLSSSTERFDRTEKFNAYRKLDSLEEYVLAAQDIKRIEVYRRRTGWNQELYHEGQSFRLESADLEMTLDEIYEQADLAAY